MVKIHHEIEYYIDNYCLLEQVLGSRSLVLDDPGKSKTQYLLPNTHFMEIKAINIL